MFKRYFAGAIISLLGICSLPGVVKGVVVDRIVAVINGEIITLGDITQIERSAKQQEENSIIPSHTPQVNQKILDRLIEKKLLLQLANKKNIKVSEKQLEAALSDVAVANQNGVDDINQLEQELLKRGLSLKELKQELETQIKINKLINIEVRAKILITQNELEEYYKQHLEDYQENEEISVRHILLPIAQDTLPKEEASIKQQAQNIMLRLNKGADFKQLVQSDSVLAGQSGTDLGYVARGDLMPKLEEVIWNLKSGETGMARTKLGYHVVLITDRKALTLENYPKIKKEIEETLYRQKLGRQSKEWLDNLRNQATIEIIPHE